LGLLKKLQSINQLSDMRLVGGTSLALQKGHRISVDLDLFGFNRKEDNLSILAAIKKEGLKIEIRKQTSNMQLMMIENVKVDIVNYPYPTLVRDCIAYFTSTRSCFCCKKPHDAIVR
jgi:hypothetical protein